jgi:ABC-2 type transport system permease protein
MTFKQQLRTISIFVKINTKRFFRDKTAIFFTVLFPLIFLFVFGGIFGGDNDISFRVALINQSQTDTANGFVEKIKKEAVFKIDAGVDDIDSAKEKMNRGQLDAAIVIPENFGQTDSNNIPRGTAEVVYTQNNEQAGQTLSSILQGVLIEDNAKYGQVSLPLTIQASSTNNKSLSQFDYTFAGLLGFSIIGIGIFGPVNIFPELKKMGILRRLHTTPLRVWQYFSATALSQLAVGGMTIVIQFAVAKLFFDLNLVGNYLELALFLTLGIITILGIGLALGGWARNERQAAPLSNIIVFPMMFLSGTFFPRFLMPSWLQQASNYLPLTPIIDGVRLIATEGKHLTDVLPQVGLLGLWLVVIYFIAFRVFRWE